MLLNRGGKIPGVLLHPLLLTATTTEKEGRWIIHSL